MTGNTKLVIDKKTVKKVAELARLRLTDKEIERYSDDLNSILKAFRDISEVDTKNTKPAFHPIDVKNITREDIAESGLSQRDALGGTKNKENGLFKGPRVV